MLHLQHDEADFAKIDGMGQKERKVVIEIRLVYCANRKHFGYSLLTCG